MLALAHGFTFAELYSARGVAKLDRVFLERLKRASPALASRLEAARAAPDSLARKAEAGLLLELAPHLEDFIAGLFGIAAECARLREEHLRLANLYTCKRQFVQRRATARVKPLDLGASPQSPVR